MHEASGHTSRTAVQILVAAPDGEVGSPVMKFQGNIACGMSQVKADDAAFFASGFRDV